MTLTQGGTPSHYGDSLAFSVGSLGGNQGGDVTFWDGSPGVAGSVELGSAPVSAGQANFTTTAVPAGQDQIYADYNGGTTSVSQTVDAVPLTILANDEAVTVGAPMPAFTFTAEGLLNGDTSASLSTQPSCTSTAVIDSSGNDTSPPGTYPIACSGAADSNYIISYQQGTLKVAPAP